MTILFYPWLLAAVCIDGVLIILALTAEKGWLAAVSASCVSAVLLFGWAKALPGEDFLLLLLSLLLIALLAWKWRRNL